MGNGNAHIYELYFFNKINRQSFLMHCYILYNKNQRKFLTMYIGSFANTFTTNKNKFLHLRLINAFTYLQC